MREPKYMRVASDLRMLRDIYNVHERTKKEVLKDLQVNTGELAALIKCGTIQKIRHGRSFGYIYSREMATDNQIREAFAPLRKQNAQNKQNSRNKQNSHTERLSAEKCISFLIKLGYQVTIIANRD